MPRKIAPEAIRARRQQQTQSPYRGLGESLFAHSLPEGGAHPESIIINDANIDAALQIVREKKARGEKATAAEIRVLLQFINRPGHPPVWKKNDKKSGGANEAGDLGGFYELIEDPRIKVLFKQDPGIEKNLGEFVSAKVMQVIAAHIGFDPSTIADVELAFENSTDTRIQDGSNVYVASVMFTDYSPLYKDAYYAFFFLDEYQALRDKHPHLLKREIPKHRPGIMGSDPVIELMITAGRYKQLNGLMQLSRAVADPDLHFENWGAIAESEDAVAIHIKIDAKGKHTKIDDIEAFRAAEEKLKEEAKSQGKEWKPDYKIAIVYDKIKTVRIDFGASFGDDRLIKRTYNDNVYDNSFIKTIIRYHPSKAGPPPYIEKIPDEVRNDQSSLIWLAKIANLPQGVVERAFQHALEESLAKYGRKQLLEFAELAGLDVKKKNSDEKKIAEEIKNYLTECLRAYQESIKKDKDYQMIMEKQRDQLTPKTPRVDLTINEDTYTYKEFLIGRLNELLDEGKKLKPSDKINGIIRKLEIDIENIQNDKRNFDTKDRIFSYYKHILSTSAAELEALSIELEASSNPASPSELSRLVKIIYPGTENADDDTVALLKLTRQLQELYKIDKGLYGVIYTKYLAVEVERLKKPKDNEGPEHNISKTTLALTASIRSLIAFHQSMATTSHPSIALQKTNEGEYTNELYRIRARQIINTIQKINNVDEEIQLLIALQKPGSNLNISEENKARLNRMAELDVEKTTLASEELESNNRVMEKSTKIIQQLSSLKEESNGFGKRLATNLYIDLSKNIHHAAENMHTEAGDAAYEIMSQQAPALTDLDLLKDTLDISTEIVKKDGKPNVSRLERNAEKLLGKTSTLKKVAGAAMMLIGGLAILAGAILAIGSVASIAPSFGVSLLGIPLSYGLMATGVGLIASGGATFFSGRQKGVSKAAEELAKARSAKDEKKKKLS